MASSYTSNIGMSEPASGDSGWGGVLNSNFTQLDAITAVGGLGVRTTENPSTTLNIRIAPGFFVNSSGVLTSYAGISSQTMVAASTNWLYLNTSGTLVVNQTGFPGTGYVPIATVVAGATTITSISDARANLVIIGGFLGTAGGTMADGATVSVGSTSGLQIGTVSTQKIGLYGATPVVQASNTSDLRTALINFGLVASGGANPLNLNGGALTVASATITGNLTVGSVSVTGLTTSGSLTLADGGNLGVGTGTGSKIGTAPSSKLGFYGNVPITQSVMGSMVASSSWGTNEQLMANTVWGLLRNLGFGS